MSERLTPEEIAELEADAKEGCYDCGNGEAALKLLAELRQVTRERDEARAENKKVKDEWVEMATREMDYENERIMCQKAIVERDEAQQHLAMLADWRREPIEKQVAEGCQDNSCYIRKPTGMATNGGCRCSQMALRLALQRCKAERDEARASAEHNLMEGIRLTAERDALRVDANHANEELLRAMDENERLRAQLAALGGLMECLGRFVALVNEEHQDECKIVDAAEALANEYRRAARAGGASDTKEDCPSTGEEKAKGD